MPLMPWLYLCVCMSRASCNSLCVNIKAKIAMLVAAKSLAKGKLLAHNTATLAGVAASMNAIPQLQRFKQRKSPFLLLAASVKDAIKLSRVRHQVLRKIAKDYWPGAVTLVFSAKKGLPAACCHHGTIAVRVDASPEVRYLAKIMGGVIVSSSLNRRKKATQAADRHSHLKLSRWINGRIKSEAQPSGEASAIFLVTRTTIKKIR